MISSNHAFVARPVMLVGYEMLIIPRLNQCLRIWRRDLKEWLLYKVLSIEWCARVWGFSCTNRSVTESLIREQSLIRKKSCLVDKLLISEKTLIRLLFQKFPQNITSTKAGLMYIITYQKIIMGGHQAPDSSGSFINFLTCGLSACFPLKVINHQLDGCCMICLSGADEKIQFVRGVCHG